MADFSNLISGLLPAVGGAAGTALGGPLGGMAGSQLGQLVGNAVGGGGQSMSRQAGGTGMGMGISQMLSGLKSKKQAEGFFPSYEDPRQMALLSEINQKRKSLETGADFAEAIQGANQAQAATQAGIVKSTGGDVGGTIQGLLQSERNTAGARNQAYSQGANKQMAYDNLYNSLLSTISGRKLQLQMQKSQQKMAEWAQSMKEGRQNFLAGLAQTYNGPNVSAPDQQLGASASAEIGGGINPETNALLGGINSREDEDILDNYDGDPSPSNNINELLGPEDFTQTGIA